MFIYINSSLLTGECWIPPKKYALHPRAKEKPHQDVRRGETRRFMSRRPHRD